MDEQAISVSDEDTDSDSLRGSAISAISAISVASGTSGVKRKRGRRLYRSPITGRFVCALTTGRNVDRAERTAAAKEKKRIEKEWLEFQIEREMAEGTCEARLTRASGSSQISKGGGQEDLGLLALQKRVINDFEMVKMVASNSNNLKGTYVKTLKDAVHSIQSAVEASKQCNPELRRLEEANAKLEEANTELRSKMESLRREVREMREMMGRTGSGIDGLLPPLSLSPPHHRL